MGWETAIFAVLSLASASEQVQNSEKQAAATTAEGDIVAENKGKEVAAKTAAQRVSFLNSGLTLEGTPMNVIQSTFNTGIKDIRRIGGNYATVADNQISSGRSAAISTLASTAAMVSMPKMPSFNTVAPAAASQIGPFDNSLPWRNTPIG